MKKNYSDWGELCASLKKTLLIMRIALVLLLAGFLQTHANDAYAQKTKVTVSFSNTELAKVLDQIENESEFFFLYNEKLIDANRKVSIDAKDERIDDVLKMLFTGTNVEYTISDRKIILAPVNMVQSQQVAKKVTGKVTDASGATLPGVSVVVKGTTNGVITDNDGGFSLGNVPGDGILQFSFVGMMTQEIKVEGKSSFNVVMSEEAIGIEEVVAVGYGTQKKVNVTGAVASVKMEDLIAKRPVNSVANALIGNVPGLTMTGNSGEPGSGYSMKIRGTSSINGGEPLVLIDNVPMSISDVNPEDIESVSVLKDASASAIYGARAAFGVILVKTKKSEKDKRNTVDYSAKYSIINPQSLLQVASPLKTIQMWSDAGAVNQWGMDVATYLGLVKEYDANPSTYPEGYSVVSGVRYGLASYDKVEDMMDNNGLQKTHDLSVSGGSQKSSYRVSIGYVGLDGILYTDKDSYNRYNVSSHLSTDMNKWLTTEFSLLYSNGKKSDPSDAGVSRNFWEMAIFSTSYYPTGYYDFNGEMSPFNTPRNILEVAVPDINKTSTMNMVGRAIITPFEGLKVTGEFSYTNINSDLQSFDKLFTQFIDGNQYIPIASTQTNSNYSNTVNATNNKAVNLYANYNKRIDSHNFGLVIGSNIERSMYKSLYASRLDMINQELPSLGQATGTTTSSDNFIESSLFGVFYRANYSYKEKYLMEASGRYDGSSKFPDNNRFGLFPSFSVGWRISEEPFMKNLNKSISNLKLRASYGSIGNQNIAAYTYLPTMSASMVNWVVNGLRSTTLGTPTLVRSNFTWEEVRTINGGLDISALNSRLSSTFDIFNRQTLGMLGPGADYPGVLGAPAPLQNSANMETKGWELEMAWQDKIGKWKYGVGFNISDNISTILKYNNETKILSAPYYEGMTLGEIWGYETDRLYTTDDFVEGTLKTTPQGPLSGGTLKPGIAKVKGAAPNPGDVLYKYPDANGDIWASSNTVSDPGSKRIIGNNSYRYVFGINADVSYKGLSLAILLTGVGKRDVWVSNASMFPLPVDWFYSLFQHQTDYWTPENTDAFYARPYNQARYSTGNNLLPQTRYLQNGAYIDIKSIVLSYEIPATLVSKIKLKKATLFINSENLFSFNHYPTGLHPDTRDRSQGSQYPVMRMFTFGANISF